MEAELHHHLLWHCASQSLETERLHKGPVPSLLRALYLILWRDVCVTQEGNSQSRGTWGEHVRFWRTTPCSRRHRVVQFIESTSSDAHSGTQQHLFMIVHELLNEQSMHTLSASHKHRMLLVVPLCVLCYASIPALFEHAIGTATFYITNTTTSLNQKNHTENTNPTLDGTITEIAPQNFLATYTQNLECVCVCVQPLARRAWQDVLRPALPSFDVSV